MKKLFFLFSLVFITTLFGEGKPAPLIILDPGHGGYNIGARVKDPYIEEKRLALRTAFSVKNQLEKKGYRVVLTRARDHFLPLERRVFIANHGKGAIFVSLHYNSCKNQDVKGIEIYYSPSFENKQKTQRSKILASYVLSSSIEKTKTASRGVKKANFFVLRESKIPAILIEGGFLTNMKERKLLRQPQYLEKLAAGITEGIDKFFHSH